MSEARVEIAGAALDGNTAASKTSLKSSPRSSHRTWRTIGSTVQSSCTVGYSYDDTTVDSGDTFETFEAGDGPRDVSLSNHLGRGSAGLSELSKQLRVLQATNHAQANTIDRLERQLKILSDLKGVSVADLKGALMDACQSEAYSELLSQVSSLQAQLLHAKESTKTAPGNSQIEFEKEAANSKIAALELRVGELEEIEERLGKEINKLYKRTDLQSAKSTRLKAASDQQSSEIEELKSLLQNAAEREKVYQATEEATRSELQRATQLNSEIQLQLKLEQEGAERLTKLAEASDREKRQRIKEVRKASNAEMLKLQTLLSEQIEKSAQLEQLTKKQRADIDTLRESSVETIKNVTNSQDVKLIAMNVELSQLRKKVEEADQAVELERQRCQLEMRTSEAATMSHLEGRKTSNAELRKLQKLLTEQTEKSARLEKLTEDQQAQIDDLHARSVEAMKAVTVTQDIKVSAMKAELTQLRKKVDEADEVVKKEKQKCKVEMKTKEDATMTHLEEVETRLRDETQNLFRRWDKEASRATQLDAALTQEKARVASLQKELAATKVSAQGRQGDSVVNQTEIDSLRSILREAELQAQVEREQAESLKEQLKAQERDAKLRKRQFRSRSEVQAKRIGDLEQQLSSLYSAFGITQTERSEEQASTIALENTLNDNAIAHQIQSELAEKETETKAKLQIEVTDAEIAHSLFLEEQKYAETTSRSSPPKKSPPPVIVGIHAGWLLKKERLKGWKKRYFVLRGNFEEGIFHLHYAEHPSRPVKGNVNLHGGSIIFPSNEFPKQPFAFAINSDPNDPKGAVSYMAAESAEDLNQWISALRLTKSSKRTPAFPVGAAVVIHGPHAQYNGLQGVVQSVVKVDGRQKVWVDSLERIISVPPDHLKPNHGDIQVARSPAGGSDVGA